jgi:DNA-binding NarL/FixJ family response regulator
MDFLTVISDCGINNSVHFDLAQLGHRSRAVSISEYAINAYLRYKPDIVLVELEHSSVYGLDLAFDLCTLDENARVAIIGSELTPAVVLEAIWAGSVALITTPLGTNSIKNAVWDIVNLDSHFSAEQIKAAALISAGVVDLQMTLCDREMRILNHLVEGKSARSIAQLLNTSEKHVRRSFDRIRCKTFAQLDEQLVQILKIATTRGR